MKTSEDFMQRAIDLAVENARTGRGGPFAAIVVKDGELIAEGVNLVTATNDPTAHAEIVAIRKACSELKEFHLAGCELYASCEPCPMCLGAIYWAHPDIIYFSGTHDEAAAAGFDDSFIYEQMRLSADQREIPMRRLLATEAERPFEAWLRAAERIPY
jgi:guanine deaminase